MAHKRQPPCARILLAMCQSTRQCSGHAQRVQALSRVGNRVAISPVEAGHSLKLERQCAACLNRINGSEPHGSSTCPSTHAPQESALRSKPRRRPSKSLPVATTSTLPRLVDASAVTASMISHSARTPSTRRSLKLQEAIVLKLRSLQLLALDGLPVVEREFINPDVSRAGLDRCLLKRVKSRALRLPIDKPTSWGNTQRVYGS